MFCRFSMSLLAELSKIMQRVCDKHVAPNGAKMIAIADKRSAIVQLVLNLAKVSFASSSVSLLPMSSHRPLIWYVFTGLRV